MHPDICQLPSLPVCLELVGGTIWQNAQEASRRGSEKKVLGVKQSQWGRVWDSVLAWQGGNLAQPSDGAGHTM
eukprot:1103029-Pelagomonas_calceolata.AAC.3